MPNLGYRKNVAIYLLNDKDEIFLGERFDTENSWQTIQGGVETHQTIEQAAYQEIFEEVGLSAHEIDIIACAAKPVKYTYPEGRDIYFQKLGWLGQEQYFHLARIKSGAIIDISAHHQEFRSWKWGSADQLLEGLVDFKKPAYLEGLRAFYLI
jgi:putative (di)nucleoside polyphosphate hydrolase